MKNITSKSGQAMIEMMTGLILILILVAGIIQFVSLSTVYCNMDARIRSNAGVVAMSNPPLVDTPQDILDWNVGADGQHMTADDSASLFNGPTNMFSVTTLHIARPDNPNDWSIFSQLPQPSSLAALHQSPAALASLGFIGIRYNQQVPVLEILQELVYNRSTILVQEDCWMPVTRGLY